MYFQSYILYLTTDDQLPIAKWTQIILKPNEDLTWLLEPKSLNASTRYFMKVNAATNQGVGRVGDEFVEFTTGPGGR
jgi:hypothetical protein